MRLTLISPPDLTPEQRPLYEDMKAGISSKYSAFTTMLDDGTILGPWSAWLHEPELGTAFLGVTKAMTRFRHLPEVPRQIVILVVGAHFRADYEIYAHSAVARTAGVSEDQLAAIIAGQRPSDLSEEAGTAYDVAAALLVGGVLSASAYQRALSLFGEPGVTELIYLVGHYCFVSMTGIVSLSITWRPSGKPRASGPGCRALRRLHADRSLSTSRLQSRHDRKLLASFDRRPQAFDE
jgi:4-carboxymuconolactone decarboxylase